MNEGYDIITLGIDFVTNQSIKTLNQFVDPLRGISECKHN